MILRMWQVASGLGANRKMSSAGIGHRHLILRSILPTYEPLGTKQVES